MKKAPIVIGTKPQLFVDDHLIEMAHSVTRALHAPTKHPANPIVKKDRPWEDVLYFRTNTFNVYWDAQEHLFKLWYEDLGWDYNLFMGRGPDGEKSVARKGFGETCHNRYLYAESGDGIVWQKPPIGRTQADGARTNIVMGTDEERVHSCSILMDPFDRDPARRFKALYFREGGGIAWGRLTAAYSADGRVWTQEDRPVVVGEVSGHVTGDVIVFTADAESGLYWLDTRERSMCERLVYPKHPVPRGWGYPYYPNEPLRTAKRSIFTTLSYDILQWPALKEILRPVGPEHNIDEEFYGMTRFRVGDLYLAFLVVHRKTVNTQEIRLMYSRDGLNWRPAGDGRPLIPHGGDGEWDQFMVETCTPPVFLEDEWRVYYAGSNLHHDWWMFGEEEGLDHPEARSGWNGGETALGLAIIRPDGFVSVDARIREGVVITSPFVSVGSAAVVNIECSGKGYFEAELSSADDDVIPGYERSAYDTFRGDAVKHVLTWRGKSELPREVLSRGAKLRFFFRNASLYSFRVV